MTQITQILFQVRKSTPKKVSRFERLGKCRRILETISEENRQTEEKETLIRTEAADALLDLSQNDPKVTDIDRYEHIHFWFWLLNIPVNNFSVMLGQSHCFLGIYQYFGELRVSCSRTL